MGLGEATLSRLVRLLSPQLTRENEREAAVTLAIGTDTPRKRDLLASLEFSGAAQIFIVKLATRFDEFGEVAPGQRPLVMLLEHFKSNSGVDKDPIYNELITVLNAPDVTQAGEALDPLELPATTPASTEKHIFISYSRRNIDAMRRLAEDLRGTGFVVWTDEKIEPGEPAWYSSVGRAIEHSYCVVVVLSPEAKNSEWVGKELEFANIHKRPIYPVMSTGDQQSALPFLLSGMQWVDLRTDYRGGLTQLTAAIRGLEPKTSPPPVPIPVPVVNKRDEYRLNETTWKQIIGRMRQRLCTVFVGAGINDGIMQSQTDFIRSWVKEFPMRETDDLAVITQFLGLVEDSPDFVKEEVLTKWYDSARAPDFRAPTSAHGILASLPVPLYVTATYDDFLFDALKQSGKKPIRRVYTDPDDAPDFDDREPLVYHLYGHREDALNAVIREDDYLTYLYQPVIGDQHFPDGVRSKIADTNLIFVGFDVTHWNFRILFRVLSQMKLNRSPHVAVQIEPSTYKNPERVIDYLKKLYGQLKFHVSISTTDEFLSELKSRLGQAEPTP